ncbi:basic helix-loop-helix protein [Maublancomyces gigas]|uniref:Basic helix-loop-helix protein n=1 Tax=Discina gigas TaxID=1032678 RepID=A0ABR3GMS2_9PEZI
MPMGDQHHDLYHDDQADGRQPQQSSPVSHLQDPTTGASASTSPQLSNASASHKRKRDSIDDSEGREDGRSVQEGSGNGRRLSFKQPSPNLSNTGSFMPVNTNSKVNQTGSPYSFQPMSNSQPSLTTMNGSTNADAANAALVAAGAMSGMLPQMTVPQPTSMGFAPVDGGKSGEHGQLGDAFGALSPPPVEGHTEGVGGNHNVPGNHSHHGSPPVGSSGNPNPKPQVGTEEWHRVRRDNHKEVERRRRETINEGINELAKIVPGCEKNKGSILQRAVQYIQQLKENEAANIEKWTLEKILTEQAISELSANNEKLQKECERAWREAETWKKSCLQAGVTRDGGTPGGSS